MWVRIWGFGYITPRQRGVFYAKRAFISVFRDFLREYDKLHHLGMKVPKKCLKIIFTRLHTQRALNIIIIIIIIILMLCGPNAGGEPLNTMPRTLIHYVHAPAQSYALTI